jgi:hypothetical protein
MPLSEVKGCRRRENFLSTSNTPEIWADEPEREPAHYWNSALDHEGRCEWGHAIENWRRASGKGLDDTAIALETAWCCCYAGQIDAGLSTLEIVLARGSVPDALRGRIEQVRFVLLLRGDRLAEAAIACKASERLLTTPRIGLPPEKEYRGQSIVGKRLLVASYGGAGDQIHYCRFLYALQEAGCADLTVVVHPGLEGFLRHNFPSIKWLAANDAWMGVNTETFDYWCTFVTLGAHFDFEPRVRAIPAMPRDAYLSCPEEVRQAWREWVERRSPVQAWRLGVNWQGRAESDASFHRASSARGLAPLTSTARTASFCLNRDLTAEGDDAVAARILFPGHEIRDFLDLAGLILGMDMIVTTCTAQAHLAGALGVPVILLLSPKPDARWGCGESTALYPSIHIVRASRVGQWDDAVDQALSIVCAARMASGKW